MPDATSDTDRQAQLLARFRAMLRPGVQIAQATLADANRLDVTLRLEDGREGPFAVAFLDGPGRAAARGPDH